MLHGERLLEALSAAIARRRPAGAARRHGRAAAGPAPGRARRGFARPVERSPRRSARGREVVIVPGNHDHQLLAPWLARRAELNAPPQPLGLQSEVDVERRRAAGGARRRARARGRCASAIRASGCARTSTRPTATTATCTRRCRCSSGSAPAHGADAERRRRARRAAEDYEAVLAPIYAWIHAVAAGASRAQRAARQPFDDDGVRSSTRRRRSSDDASRRAWHRRGCARRATARRGLRRLASAVGLNRAGFGPLHADLSGVRAAQGRAAGIRGGARRAAGRGPLRDLRAHTPRRPARRATIRPSGQRRRARACSTRGCWVHEPAFLGPDPARSPYRAGFAVDARRAAGAAGDS